MSPSGASAGGRPTFWHAARSDRFLKRRRYQEAGTPLYWIVDGEQQVEVWTTETRFPLIERERLVWQPPGAAAPFTLALAEFLEADLRRRFTPSP